MAKPSGLGRGLGDLLDDNNPSLRVQSATVVIRGTQQTEEPQKKQTSISSLYASTPQKPLFETKPKNKSFK